MATTTKQRLTPEQRERKQLAERVIKMRGEGKKWDGDDGICKTLGLKGAPVGRQLMREFGEGDAIAPLSGKRLEQQQEAQQRKAKAVEQRRKAAAKAKAEADAKPKAEPKPTQEPAAK